jgi:DNA polymerase I-like protein with 3'-5' exonuclease and polymerase domains
MAKEKRSDIGGAAGLVDTVKTTRKKAAKARVKKDKSIRAKFRALLRELDLDKVKKPWMAQKSFRLLTTEDELAEWVDTLLNDESRWQQPYFDKPERMPVVAVDTETWGLDTRIITHIQEVRDDGVLRRDANGTVIWEAVYEVKNEIAGICLSYDGISGVYIPLFHEDGHNVPRDAVKRHLQRLFDRSHLVFYNAKFDREVLRLTCGIKFRPYPYYEDVQALYFSNDPKADLEDDTFSGSSGGLKKLSETVLNPPLKQIDLATIGKVTADWCPITENGFSICTEEDRKTVKHRNLVQYVPFTWIPTYIALWYAAADGICTWLLWAAMREEAQRRKRVHAIDGELIDTLTWMERQRHIIDTEPLERLKKWHMRTMAERQEALRKLANAEGWEEQFNEDGKLIDTSKFSVSSPPQLAKLLFVIKKMTVVKRSAKTDKPSVDADALVDLLKLYPTDKFLLALEEYKEYVALHPESFRYDPVDYSARLYLKQNTVAGGRLAASGGKFDRDGGFGLNPQAIKTVNKAKCWFVKGQLLTPDYVMPEDVEPYPLDALDPSCFRPVNHKTEKLYYEADAESGNVKPIGEEVDPAAYRAAALAKGWVERPNKKGALTWHKVAPGIINNHIANALGYSICLVKGCTSCAHKHGILIEDAQLDANQIINFRKLFIAAPGWTVFTSDYSGIEMRVAANESLEPAFIREFLEGAGDFHTLTATVIFPEFSDPNTSKERRKELRSIAKIINFALLYGGSEYTIYENLKKTIPDITMKDTKKMVDTYWAGVPEFKRYCEAKQRIAREEMTCTTATGRIIKFESQMKALRLHVPTEIEMENYFTYLRLKKAWKKAEADVDKALADSLKQQMDAMWKETDTGVRNAIDYNKFMSKIQRVSVNVPLQGLAGDIMRMALNRIRKWASILEPLVQSVLRVNSSVHDEVDYAAKNEYAPFVVPRVTRVMKLRRLHESRKWPVGIECDTEYGRSWDVSSHLTGDDGHKPAAYTDIPGLENYLPEEFESATFERLLKAILSPKDSARDFAWKWLQTNLHAHAFAAAWHAFYFLDDEKQTQRLTAEAVVRKQLTAALQLHEYWMIDEVPDDQDHTMETFEQYEKRRGLTAADRGFMPLGGFLGTLPLEDVRRPTVPVLGSLEEPPAPETPLPLFDMLPDEGTDTEDVEPKRGEIAVALDNLIVKIKAEIRAGIEDQIEEQLNAERKAEFEEAMQSIDQAEAPNDASLEDELFLPAPKKRKVEEEVIEPEPDHPELPDLPVVRPDLTSDEADRLDQVLGIGPLTVRFIYRGEVVEFRKRYHDKIPPEFLVEVNHV